jgi:hypothetical protein
MMERAKLSGALLVSKIPPNAGRSVQYLRPVPDDGDAATFATPDSAQPAPASAGSGRRTAFWFAAIGAVVFAVASVTGLALLLPTGPDRVKPTASLPFPTAAPKLAKAAIDSALQVPALRPAAVALTSSDASPAPPPPRTAKTAAAASDAALAKSAGSPAQPKPTPPDASTSPAPPTSPAPAPAGAPTVPSLLRARGDTLFAAGHLAAARDCYRRAAEAGDGQAALQLGETYDPAFLALAGLFRERGDAPTAAYWYRQASKLGMHDSNALLRGLAAELVAASPK